ncbi:MAG: hypothetical protein ACJA1U_001905, partial [Bermanella sp.]
LQNGHEFLGFYSDASFTLNGAVEVRGGGTNGSGINIDADMLITDGNFTLTKSNGVGIHLDDVTYEFHMRDMTMDVDNDGIKLVLGELWSEFAANDIRFGGRTTGRSLGGLAITQYEKGSEIVISGGGANLNRCMGGTGADAAACAANGGTWIDTGTEGLTIKNKRVLLKENITEGKSNAITYETNRVVGERGTGQAIKLNNIFTSDGYDENTNTYGVENTTSVDVASAGTTPTATLMISNNVKIKELNVGNVQMLHNPSGSSSNMLQGIKMQNIDFTSHLSVTPIP